MGFLRLALKTINRRGGIVTQAGQYKARRRQGNRATGRRGIVRRAIFLTKGRR